MSPRDENLLKALNLLVLLFRTRKRNNPKLDELQQHTLTVTKEHLDGAGLTIPVFTNTLETLDKKGYLTAVSIFENKAYQQAQELFDGDKYDQLIKEAKVLNTPEQNLKLKEGLATYIEKTLPADYQLDRQGLMSESITWESLLKEIRPLVSSLSPDTSSVIVLMPFRSIERLLDKMNEGINFDDIQDATIWYDEKSFILHFGKEQISTAYRGTPTKVHFIFQTLFNQTDKLVIDYSDIKGFDDIKREKESKAYSDTIRNFIKKHPKLEPVFHVYSDRLEIDESFKDDVH